METNFLVVFTFLLLQRFGGSMIMTSSSNVTCIEREMQSLLEFKQALSDRYNLLSTWIGVECCKWRGVGCDSRNGHVVKLDLRTPVSLETIINNDKFGLEGKLSHSLQMLKHLRYLDLSMNKFKGNIPEFIGSFQRLEYLNLSGSGFSGGVVPHHLGNLSRLQYLDIKNAFRFEGETIEFQVPIVDDLIWVSSLSSLRHLDLSGISIGNHPDWLHRVSMLPSLLTLNLANCGIKKIPSMKMINFTSLSSLDLSNILETPEQINSIIPSWLSNLTGLMHLNLYDNLFHGKIPDFFGAFSALTSIDLSYNSFESSIPDVLCNLSSLIRLDLSGNMFYGPIPANLGQLLSLEKLWLHDNQFSANIPVSLGELSKLVDLDLHQNSLVGVVSETHFTKLKNLINLDISLNSLALNFSYQWIAPFQLHVFVACSCIIGPYFPKWLQTQTNLLAIDFYNSSIKDTIPEWFENILSHIDYLDLSNNQIGGKLTLFHFNSNNWQYAYVDLNSNKFEGSLATVSSNLFYLDLSDNLLSGHVPEIDGTTDPTLILLDLSKNRFTGNIPLHLCKVPSIMFLDLSQNKLSGRLPKCIGSLINLQAMDLSNNNITGGVPTSLGSLTKLVSLHLHHNRFEGYLPLSLQNLTRLATMDIGYNFFVGNIPFWIGENLLNLKILNFQSNKFTGKIPLQLCKLNTLQHLNLAQNNIIGMIPRCLGNLSGMIIDQVNIRDTGAYYEENILAFMKGIQLVYTKTIDILISLDLSSNNITGEIPDVLVNLVGLKNLNLSRNRLKGHVPIRIGNLNQLESLDLSMNMLSGRIPQSLTSLNFLGYLNLSFNKLSGSIPVGNQLQTLAEPFVYEGNDGLCGPLVSRSCKGNKLSYIHVDEDDDDDDDDEGMWFYSGMGIGFVIGFLGLLGSLHFIRSWRVAYFGTLENVYGWLTASVLLNLARLRRKAF